MGRRGMLQGLLRRKEAIVTLGIYIIVLKKTKLAIMGALLLLFTPFAFASNGVLENDPNGFKGFTWNTSIEEFSGLVLWGASSDNAVSKTYYFPNEPRSISGIDVEKILYVFQDERFIRATVKFQGGEQYHALVIALTDRFGQGKDESQFSHDLLWVGVNTHIVLRYDDQFDLGALIVSNLQHRPK